jgi:septation ring formation regulator EzrA
MTQMPETNYNDLREAVQSVIERLDRLTIDVEKSTDETKEANIRIDAYQKASNQVVNLAFTVIAAAAAVTILSPAVKAVAEYFTR